MNTGNSETNEGHRFKLDLTGKLILKNPKKNINVVDLSIFYAWENIKSEYNNNRFKFQHQLAMKLLIYQMILIRLMIFKIILNL